MVLPVSTENIIKSMALFKNKEDLDLEESSFNKSSDVIQSEESFEVSKNTVIRVSINTQRMPIFFLGSFEDKKELELRIKDGNGRWELVNIERKDKDENIEIIKLELAMSPSFGLLTGFDMDVLTVIEHKLHECKNKNGQCPDRLRLWLSDFPKIMKGKKHGDLYKRIRESVMRLSETSIYSQCFLNTKNNKDSKKDRIKGNKTIKLLQHDTDITTVSFKNKLEALKSFIDIRIPEWLINDINNNYTTELNINTYFMIGSDRSRYLYRLLELLRHKPTVRIFKEKIEKEMNLQNIKQTNLRKRGMVRAILPLVEIGFIKNYRFDDDFLYIDFADVKKNEDLKYLNQVEDNLTIEQKELLNDLIVKLEDSKSRAWFIKIVSQVPLGYVRGALADTLDKAQNGTVHKTKGAIFTYYLNESLEKNKLKLK